MNYTEILTICEKVNPDLIYVAVGCASPNEPSQGLVQQYPPFVKEWPGTKLCILIDPLLEDPPRSTQELQAIQAIQGDVKIWKTPDSIFISLRQNLYYYHDTVEESSQKIDDIRFIEILCRQTLIRSAKMIVQDYTGREIQQYYPHHIHPDITKSVLYDVTYDDGGCYIDFDTIQILKNEDGEFIQPSYSPLSAIHGKIPDPIFQKELTRRRQNLTNIHTYVCIVRGLREHSTWITEERIASSAHRYATIYRVNSKDFVSILIAAVKDLCATASCYLSSGEIDAIVSSPTQQYANLFQTLQVVLKIPA